MASLTQFCLWLEQTALSQAIQGTAWIVPAVQTVHIVAIATVIGAVLMLNLRLLRLVGRDQPVGRFSARFLPVIWWALPVLLVTGAAMIVTAFYQFRLARGADLLKTKAQGRGAAIAIAIPSLALWTAIVFAGRW